jgi:hypothetical protein
MLGSLLFHPLMSVPRIPGMTDEELLIYVMREAQLILAEDIDRRSRDPEETSLSCYRPRGCCCGDTASLPRLWIATGKINAQTAEAATMPAPRVAISAVPF